MKREIVDTERRLHITSNGGVYPIDRLEYVGEALYIEREFRDHPHVRYFQAYLLPEHGWQVCRYIPHQGAHWCDWYVDICRIEVAGARWIREDLYLDLGVHDGRGYDLLDAEELGEAVAAGELRVGDAGYALHALQRFCDRLKEFGYQVQPLLDAVLYPAAQVASARAPSLPTKGKGAVGG